MRTAARELVCIDARVAAPGGPAVVLGMVNGADNAGYSSLNSADRKAVLVWSDYRDRELR